jgi:hypothetical protein
MITIHSPFEAPTRVLILSNPINANTIKMQLNVALKQFMGRDYKKTFILGPLAYVHDLSFETLGKAKTKEVLDFFKYEAGNFLRYTDYNSNQWKVRLAINELTGKYFNTCVNSISFTLEGIKA